MGAGWKPVPAPAPQSSVAIKPENAAGDPRRPVDGRQRRRHRRPGADSRATTSSGKTGTAQVISLEGGRAAAGKTDADLRDHGWFVFFAPRDNPQIAGVVFAEHAEHGSSAAPIAKHALETFFAKQEGRPLPPPLEAADAAAAAEPRGRGRRRRVASRPRRGRRRRRTSNPQ